MATVRYSLSRTLNIGNYESTRVQVDVELDGDNNELDFLYNQAKDFVVDKVDGEVDEILESIENE